MNVLFDYMYRDFGNWKMGGEAVFANPNALPLADAEQRLRKACCLNDNFNARQVGIQEVYFETTDVEADQIYHEFCALEATAKPATDARSLLKFVEEFEAASILGWDSTPRLDKFGYALPVGRRVVESAPPAPAPAAPRARTPRTHSPSRVRRAARPGAKAAGEPEAKQRNKRPRAKS